MLKLKLQYFGPLMWRVDSLEKTHAGRDQGQEEKGTTEDEMAGWHHWLDGRESEWTLGVGDGQGGLACCDSWGCKESDTTERLNWTELIAYLGLSLTSLKTVSFLKPELNLFMCAFFSHKKYVAYTSCWINVYSDELDTITCISTKVSYLILLVLFSILTALISKLYIKILQLKV